MKGWTTTTFVAIGALAALYVILSLPGALLAGITGTHFLAAIGNILIIGIMYPLVALLFKRSGAVTLWALIVGFLFIPLPLGGPPGFLLKVIYMGCWGFIADVTYLPFKHNEKVAAIAIGIVQLGLGTPISIFLWTLFAMPELATQAAQFSGVTFIIISSILGVLLGYAGYFIYKKLEKTSIIQRIQR